MVQSNDLKDIIEQLKKNPPKIIGGYKKQGWAVKVLEKISNDAVEQEEDGTVTAKAVLEAKDATYFPAFLHLDLMKKGQIIGAYFISENDRQFDLIPFEIAKEFMNKKEEDLVPFKYRTLEKIEGDEFQVNWPEFS
ncbi:hypothetical protein PB1_08967 [Bacillus methanolicus PB1]|uniref:Uncharacterized protein n=1 Tax=Bacillus methanolicus PB1 TaxID=997296 RepID=I3E1V8_BACMT|nr:hypothetical protein [Bacillus methanolicus]EIJ80479.1 hypothetical protein PB1_08967 [Bacillus methanolicus PB1]